MNGIDTAVASLLASRIDSLLAVSARSGATASQTDASLNVKTPVVTPAEAAAPLPASAQTALSAVALTLDAITRSGGEATPALIGQMPLWPAAPAIEVTPLPLFDTQGAASTAAAAQGGTDGTQASGVANAASIVATAVPVAELAAALARTVDESGLFYESHLAQWLSGQRPVESLADEPQNHLADTASQLPLDWDEETGDALSWAQGRSQGGAPASASGNFAAARGGPGGPQAQSARFTTFDLGTNDIIDMADDVPPGTQRAATGGAAAGMTAEANAQGQQAMSAALHPATIPLVRQQLDLLATGQFRWTGEAWPGARLDWTIEQEDAERRRGDGTSADEDYPWRTRLTLSLPTLGTVDAELTLTGSRLAVRVLASSGGAARLSAQGEAFRQRLAEAGIVLSGLSIREIGGSAVSVGAAAAAASAYASASSTSSNSSVSDGHADWDAQ
jgi:hypothetical protein